ncbi:MAG TPA: hypothetical protein VM096_06720 [Vicinamibacterales bacterium]|nr:hypothetical protein [Vicinamibacterales bacterium]
MKKTFISAVAFSLLSSAALAQTGTDMVEVEPITCWWRTSTSAVQTGQSFGLTLTCAVVETEANKVVPDFSKLDPTVVQLPPFEVLGGTHAGDLKIPGKRFFQYDYRLRLIAEDAFGNDVSIPPLEISYRIESQVKGGDTTQGRDQSYSLPRASVRLISLVPDDTSDIREAPASPFTSIENRESRANLLQTVAGILFGLAAVFALVMLISMIRRKTPKSAVEIAHLGPRTILGAVSKELDEVQRASRGGWTPELVGRALAALRVAGAYATNRPIGQRPAKPGETPQEGVIVVRQFGRGEVYISGAATTETAAFVNNTAGLSDAMKTLTIARFGRVEKFDSMADEAIQTAIRVTKDQRSRHSLLKEWAASFTASVVDLRKKVWA